MPTDTRHSTEHTCMWAPNMDAQYVFLTVLRFKEPRHEVCRCMEAVCRSVLLVLTCLAGYMIMQHDNHGRTCETPQGCSWSRKSGTAPALCRSRRRLSLPAFPAARRSPGCTSALRGGFSAARPKQASPWRARMATFVGFINLSDFGVL